MKTIIGVSNFGKIRSAEIDVSNFAIFVGNNNSGKTYMMQLLYGVIQELLNIEIPRNDYSTDIGKRITFENEWFAEYEKTINEYLEKQKNEIVFKIFHRAIPIERLYIRLKDIHEKIVISFKKNEKPFVTGEKDSRDLIVQATGKEVLVQKHDIRTRRNYGVKIRVIQEYADKLLRNIISIQVASLLFNMPYETRNNSLYLPPSRTGMLLLYKYFFAEKDEKIVTQMNRNANKVGNELGLSAPVYDFLQFLLRYIPNEESMHQNSSLIAFIEQHLIDGKVKQEGEETVYIPENADIQIPLYLSSSMVNELTPLVKALTGAVYYKYFFYDEIETCLHPAKQGEMARLLFRLNNSGRKLIVSTHSDTMASKINNLLLLSFADISTKEKEIRMQKLELCEDDLLKSDDIHVYQFTNVVGGSSEVEELEFRKVPYTGYDFSQFADSAQNLYMESVTVME